MSVIRFEASQSFEEGATFARDGDGLVVSVAEEKAVDSYNESFECDLHMTRKQVEQLRDWLLVEFPK